LNSEDLKGRAIAGKSGAMYFKEKLRSSSKATKSLYGEFYSSAPAYQG
jgi:hypothetical protein